MWLLYAAGSAVFAGLTAILAKVGIRHTPSNLATAIRTVVVLVFAWLVVFIVGSGTTITTLSVTTVVFLVLSGLATGASWLCYFRALQLADVNQVTPIDKSSIVLTVLFAILLLGETDDLVTRLLGITVIGVGTFLMIERRGSKHRSASGDPAGQGEAAGSGERSDPSENGVSGDSSGSSEDGGSDGRLTPKERRDLAEPLGPDDPSGTSQHTVVRGRGWLFYAFGSAVFAALTAILGKVGITDVESNLGTAIRTCVVLVMAWIVAFATGEHRGMTRLPRRDLLFIVLSGIATGASWLCYFRALQEGPASLVVPIDKTSIVLTVAFAWVFLGERLTRRGVLGLVLIVAGTLLMLI